VLNSKIAKQGEEHKLLFLNCTSSSFWSQMYFLGLSNVLTIRTWFSRHGGVGLMIGLNDFRDLFQP